MGQNVAILGASNKPDRYAYKAMKLLLDKGHAVYLVHPKLSEVEGEPVYSKISEIPKKIDTLTLYINADRQELVRGDILELHPSRVIFNPGSENPEFAKALEAAGIQTEEACTLVLLHSEQF